jgi:hypothetical protein
MYMDITIQTVTTNLDNLDIGDVTLSRLAGWGVTGPRRGSV